MTTSAPRHAALAASLSPARSELFRFGVAQVTFGVQASSGNLVSLSPSHLPVVQTRYLPTIWGLRRRSRPLVCPCTGDCSRVPRPARRSRRRCFKSFAAGAACSGKRSRLRHPLKLSRPALQGDTLSSPFVKVSWRLSLQACLPPSRTALYQNTYAVLQSASLPPHTVCIYVVVATASSPFAACDNGVDAAGGSVSLMLTHPGVNIITGACSAI